MPKGRQRGYKRPQAEIDKARMTRIVNRNKKAEIKAIAKPVLIISRKWQTGFDFWPGMRNTLRPLHRYAECRNVERMIVQKGIWDNREEIVKILENYFVVQLKKVKSVV